MKEPTRKEDKESAKDEGVLKLIDEQHFCPVCDKPTAIYFLGIYEDDREVTLEIDNKGWYFMGPEYSKLEINFSATGDFEVDILTFEPGELGITKTPMDIIKELNAEYLKKYNIKDKRTTSFCSKKCAKKFILSKIEQRGP